MGLSELEPPSIHFRALGTSQLPSNQTSEANGCDYQFEGKCRVRYEMRGPTLQSERSNRTPVSVGYSKNPTTWEPTPVEIYDSESRLITNVMTRTEHNAADKHKVFGLRPFHCGSSSAIDL